MELLRVEALRKTYGEGENQIAAVDDISFSVNKGEFVAIVGASGSGKSTLLHLIGGVDRPTSGSVLVDGTNIFDLDDDQLAIFRRRQIGIVYQFYNLIPTLDVEENITLPIELDGQKPDRDAVDRMLRRLRLLERRHHLPSQLSGGQQQRASIGRALIRQPALLLADEPTGNLDSKAGEEIVSLLKEANWQFHQTILMITHDLEIAKLAQRTILIEDGRILQDTGH